MISFNCLPEHETLGEFARRECVESIDIRFCRNDAEAGAGETFIATCAVVIPPFLAGCIRRIHAAIFSFWAGVMPPMPMFGRSLL